MEKLNKKGQMENNNKEYKNIIIGCDHAGLDLKQTIIDYLTNNNFNIYDIGTYSKDSCDYPDIAKSLVNKFRWLNNSLGILICGTGIGMSIAVNKFNDIRGALIYNSETAKLAKEHNNANVIIFGARMFSIDVNLSYLKIFLASSFSNEKRHINRIEKLSLL